MAIRKGTCLNILLCKIKAQVNTFGKSMNPNLSEMISSMEESELIEYLLKYYKTHGCFPNYMVIEVIHLWEKVKRLSQFIYTMKSTPFILNLMHVVPYISKSFHGLFFSLFGNALNQDLVTKEMCNFLGSFRNHNDMRINFPSMRTSLIKVYKLTIDNISSSEPSKGKILNASLCKNVL